MTFDKLQKIFFIITITSSILLIYSYLSTKGFNNEPLSLKTKQRLQQKENHLKYLALQKYNLKVNFPTHISLKMGTRLYGLASYDEDKIEIYLNKKRFRESEDYMIDYVFPHEYAHAIVFQTGKFSHENGGHTKEWQDICLALEGKKCDRFVQENDILMGKLKYIY